MMKICSRTRSLHDDIIVYIPEHESLSTSPPVLLTPGDIAFTKRLPPGGDYWNFQIAADNRHRNRAFCSRPNVMMVAKLWNTIKVHCVQARPAKSYKCVKRDCKL